MLFSRNLKYKSKNLNKIWKFKNPRWWSPVTSFIWQLLPWKPIRYHVVLLNWNYKWSLLYVQGFTPIGWIVLKVEGGGGLIDPSLPLKVSCNYFCFEASSVNYVIIRSDRIKDWSSLAPRARSLAGLLKSFFKNCQGQEARNDFRVLLTVSMQCFDVAP